ncbi:MAG: T9SS type A sorting domain-containing protein [Candidatus Kapaibacteriota bacterium]
MKRAITIFFVFALVLSNSIAETTTVEVANGKSYSNWVWYNLEDDATTSAALNAWDLSILTKGTNATIRINSGAGCRLWEVVGKTVDDFGNVIDTTGLNTDQTKFVEWLDSDESWVVGAFNMGKNGFEDNGDFGWGEYNMSTHAISGKKLFIFKDLAGNYYQMRIEDLIGGILYFSYADLNGNNSKTVEFNKKNYSTKSFAYYSLATTPGEKLDLEPSAWSLLFGKYMAMVDNGQGGKTPYNVNGILINYEWSAVKVAGQDPSTVTTPTNDSFTSNISTIGHLWKHLNQDFQWEIPSDLCYFVMSPDGLIWKIVFTGFEGASTGKVIFEKTPVEPNSVKDNNGNITGNFAITPNIVAPNEAMNITYSTSSNNSQPKIEIFNLNSQKQYEMNLPASNFNALQINPKLSSGIYFVVFSINGNKEVQKLIVQ